MRMFELPKVKELDSRVWRPGMAEIPHFVRNDSPLKNISGGFAAPNGYMVICHSEQSEESKKCRPLQDLAGLISNNNETCQV